MCKITNAAYETIICCMNYTNKTFYGELSLTIQSVPKSFPITRQTFSLQFGLVHIEIVQVLLLAQMEL